MYYLRSKLLIKSQLKLTGRYGERAPQASATNNRLSANLWLIYQEKIDTTSSNNHKKKLCRQLTGTVLKL